MKKIKLSIYTLLLSLAFVSCESETTDPVIGEVKSTQQVEIGFSDTNNNAIIIEDGGSTSVEVSLSRELPYDTTVELEVTSSDGSLEKDSGDSEITYDAMVIIPAGSMSVTANLSFIDDEKNDDLEVYSISIKNATTPEPLEKYFLINDEDKSNNSRSIIVYDVVPNVLPVIVDTVKGDVEIELSWEDSFRDMDLFLLKGEALSFLNLVDDSQGFEPLETVTLLSTQSENKFYVYVSQYQFTADVDYKMNYTFPDGQITSFEDVVSESKNLFTFDKVENGNNVKYLISKL